MSAYYNEIDPFAAQWLRNLIAAGHIAPGEVDTRSIADVTGTDLAGYTQCHFFAGLGGWSHALRLAGWPDDRPIWTGSCPCQPFSAAGKGDGADDPRHLWPTWFRLIRECRPRVVAGEQVAAAIGHGWLDLVCTDLEAEDYAVGAVVLPAASVGAPHKRDRCWFVADAQRDQQSREEPCGGSASRVGWFYQSVPWNRSPECALREFRVVDDGLRYGVDALDAVRNAIVPQVAAEVLKAYMVTRYTEAIDKLPPVPHNAGA